MGQPTIVRRKKIAFRNDGTPISSAAQPQHLPTLTTTEPEQDVEMAAPTASQEALIASLSLDDASNSTTDEDQAGLEQDNDPAPEQAAEEPAATRPLPTSSDPSRDAETALQLTADLQAICARLTTIQTSHDHTANEMRGLLLEIEQRQLYALMPEGYKSMAQYLRGKIPYSYSFMCRQLRAAKTEALLRIPIGTYSEKQLVRLAAKSVTDEQKLAVFAEAQTRDSQSIPSPKTLNRVLAEHLKQTSTPAQKSDTERVKAAPVQETAQPTVETTTPSLHAATGSFFELPPEEQRPIVMQWLRLNAPEAIAFVQLALNAARNDMTNTTNPKAA
ncbi:MAG: hypothetical protein HQL99_16600 [Magnetococcales bacterium]|nr:hypothetical protein [Magnetococcales bacterium]